MLARSDGWRSSGTWRPPSAHLALAAGYALARSLHAADEPGAFDAAHAAVV
jgi:hypothetical protein